MDWIGLAIDGGGSKTQVALVDPFGHTLASKVFPGNNVKSFGVTVALETLHTHLNDFLQEADVQKHAIQSVVCGFAGAGREAEKNQIQDTFTSWFPDASIFVTHDAHLALASGTYGADGLVVIAGTGSIVFGTAGNDSVRVGGWGNRLGDEGSGYWLGREVLTAVMKSHDGRLQNTLLTKMVFEHLQISSVDELLNRVYDQQMTIQEMAQFSRYAFLDDPVAEQIRRTGAYELAMIVQTARNRLGHIQTLVLQGGVFQEQMYVDLLKKQLTDVTMVQPIVPPISGAIALLFEQPLSASIIEQINRDWTDPTFINQGGRYAE